MSGRIDLKSVRLKTAQKYSNWLLFYLFFQKQAPFSVPSPEGERAGVRGGALFKGKEGRGDFRKDSSNSFSNLRNQLPSMGNNPNIAIGMFPQKRFYDRSE